jgi:hypothetical protein
VLRSIQAAVAWLGQQLHAAPSRGTAAPQQQQLQQLQASVCQALQDVLQQSYSAWEGARAGDSSSSSSSSQPLVAYVAAGAAGDAGADVLWGATVVSACTTAVKPNLAQQLQQFGAAVCALLPSKLCCNALDCCCCERLSEGELVGGKMSHNGIGNARDAKQPGGVPLWKRHV